MNLLPKSEPARLPMLLALEAQRRRARKLRRIVWTTMEAAALLAAFVTIILASRPGYVVREAPIVLQLAVWFAWVYAAATWAACRLPTRMFDRGEG